MTYQRGGVSGTLTGSPHAVGGEATSSWDGPGRAGVREPTRRLRAKDPR